MQLSKPGPVWYTARLISVVPQGSMVVGSFQVYDAGRQEHNGISLDGTPQQYLEVEIDPAALPDDIKSAVRGAIQRLVIAEYGSVAAAIRQCIEQGVEF